MTTPRDTVRKLDSNRFIYPDHLDDCVAVRSVHEGHWSHPWGTCEYDFPGFDKTGRKNPRSHTAFIVWCCNNTDCPAKLYILAEYVERKLLL